MEAGFWDTLYEKIYEYHSIRLNFPIRPLLLENMAAKTRRQFLEEKK